MAESGPIRLNLTKAEYRQLKIKAARDGTTIKNLVTQAIRETHLAEGGDDDGHGDNTNTKQ